MLVHTESGSVYQFEDGMVRRVGARDMRGDGEWLPYRMVGSVEVGQPLVMGITLPGGIDTVRMTSHVVGVTL